MAFSYDSQSVKQLLTENSVEEFLAASSILVKFAANILDNPSQSKYRRIRISNPTVQNKLLNVVGGMECLFEMGFQEADDGECLVFPFGTSLQILRTIKDDLTKEREKIETKQKLVATISGPQTEPALAAQPEAGAAGGFAASQSTGARVSQLYMDTEAAFLAKLKDALRRVMNYESKSSQSKAKDVIPVERLQEAAKQKFQENSGAGSKLDVRDYLLLELLNWFKSSFFQWVDTLPCSQCNGSTQNTGYIPPSADDLRWGASRVEGHQCSSCSFVNRFPRYTIAERLLETCRGRCGEWAECFTLCCRALDFEARYVIDWTDHVWTEVYSNSLSRWLHCDPCENICDKPLLYESGWGKNLTYVIAVSKDEIRDVTWRYSAKHKELLERRNLCRESWLRRTIHQLWKQKISALPQEMQQELWRRLICELTEFITMKDGSGEALPGRTTGSLEWRQARGELGQLPQESSNFQNNFVFTPTEAERECEMIHVVYNCAIDKYVRLSSNNKENQGWETFMFSAQDISRKVEHDWKMAYLARQQGSAYAEVSWKFDLTNTDLRISRMEIKAESAVFEGGSISWRICAAENCFMHTGGSLQQVMTFDLHGCKTLTITAVLQGGKGDLAWQHTQLFRQSTNDRDSYPFEIKLILN